MSFPLVSLHILNYNGGEDILRCLESVFQLTYPNFRVVVIDNASTDDSLQQITARFPAVTLMQNASNLGFGAGHNVGLRDALEHDISYVWLLNQDTIVAPDALNFLVTAVENDPAIGAASPIIFNPDQTVWFENGQIDWGRMRTVHVAARSGSDPDFLTGCALFVRTAALKVVGLFDERFFLYYEDADLSLRLHQGGFHLFVESQAKIWHTEASQKNAPAKTGHLVFSGLLFFQKHARSRWRVWHHILLPLRRFKNWLDVTLRPHPVNRAVQGAYRDWLHRNS